MYALIPQQTPEERIIELWLSEKSERTKQRYGWMLNRFRQFLGKPLLEADLIDLHTYREQLEHSELAPNTQKLAISAIKSFYSFVAKAFLLPVNIGAAIKTPHGEDSMHERMLTEYEVQRMIVEEPDTRNQVLLRLLYTSGVRVSEVCGLRWKDIVARDGGTVQISVLGKRQKRRQILLSETTSTALLCLGRGQDGDYVFKSEAYHSTQLTERAVQYIVKAAAKRAEVHDWQYVSPHWLRHSHASHALQRNAPMALVRDTLGHSSIAITNRYVHARPGESSGKYLPTF